MAHSKNIDVCFVCSGWRRVSPTSRRASTGDRTWCATWPTTTSTIGCGRRLSSAAKPTASTSRSSSRCATAPSFPARPSRARRRFRCSTTSSTLPPASRRLGNLKATSSSTASQPTRDDSLHPTRYNAALCLPCSGVSIAPCTSATTRSHRETIDCTRVSVGGAVDRRHGGPLRINGPTHTHSQDHITQVWNLRETNVPLFHFCYPNRIHKHELFWLGFRVRGEVSGLFGPCSQNDDRTSWAAFGWP